MRITPEILLRLAKDWIEQQVRVDRSILAIYLHGSLLSNAPDLGGALDIDLCVVRVDIRQPEREIKRITDDIHLDIVYHARNLYQNTRALRLDPWLGPTLNDCKILYDPNHFLDFVQAGVRAQFDWPENVLRRARQCYDRARADWLRFQQQTLSITPDSVRDYLEAVEHTANAVALLAGSCLTERRFLPQFAVRAAVLNHPGLYVGLIGLLGGAQVSPDTIRAWLPEWKQTFLSLPDGHLAERLSLPRFNYYMRAFEQYLTSDTTAPMALWPLLRTWTDMAGLSNASESWRSAVMQLGWNEDGLTERLRALDAYLDTVDETLERWGEEHGVR